jgi:hypothetical protein
LPQCREFWLVSNRFLARLYTSPLVTVAAIRGAAVSVFQELTPGLTALHCITLHRQLDANRAILTCQHAACMPLSSPALFLLTKTYQRRVGPCCLLLTPRRLPGWRMLPVHVLRLSRDD